MLLNISKSVENLELSMQKMQHTFDQIEIQIDRDENIYGVNGEFLPDVEVRTIDLRPYMISN